MYPGRARGVAGIVVSESSGSRPGALGLRRQHTRPGRARMGLQRAPGAGGARARDVERPEAPAKVSGTRARAALSHATAPLASQS